MLDRTMTRRQVLRWIEGSLVAATVSGSIPARAFAGVATVDLVVYGGTPAGIMAAVTAAHAGLHVILVEPSDRLGGMVTGGLGLTDVGNRHLVGGLTLKFFRQVEAHYGSHAWNLEPHLALQFFEDMLHEANVVVQRGKRLREGKGVRKSGAVIEALQFEDGSTLEARMFIDATYEGDLLAQAAVSHVLGREGASEFEEPWGGVQTYPSKYLHLSPADMKGHLLPEISSLVAAPVGSADNRLMAYTFRLCLTSDASNRLPLPKPPGYDPARYALLGRILQHHAHPNLDAVAKLSPLPNNKIDLNNAGFFSTDYVGGSSKYPTASYRERSRIWQEHYNYVSGLLYFLSNEPTVSDDVRGRMASYGLAKDEFTGSHGWPGQLYVREARRMRGVYTMTQRDITTETIKEDSVGMGSYQADSHNMQRLVVGPDMIANEGGMFHKTEPYAIPFRSLLPKPADATNLLVPVCLSSSHVAFCTIRMEPQWMILGEAAGLAVAKALQGKTTLHHLEPAALTAALRDHGSVLSLADAAMAKKG
ncbi:MAG: FAD-dependent oxidoreductase [Acidobacteriaceae bacterium]|nr:FAD-dependent oxidoreductase [Acidobacteriaceae bacterium]